MFMSVKRYQLDSLLGAPFFAVMGSMFLTYYGNSAISLVNMHKSHVTILFGILSSKNSAAVDSGGKMLYNITVGLLDKSIKALKL